MEHAEGKQLQKVLNKVDEMRCQRFQLVSTLNADIDADDITKKALSERDYDSKVLHFYLLGGINLNFSLHIIDFEQNIDI